MTQVDKLVAFLMDGEWHHSIDLNNEMGWKWCARLSDARKKGYSIEDRKDDSEPKYKFYRLINIPDELSNGANLSIINQFNSKMDAILQREAFEYKHPTLI